MNNNDIEENMKYINQDLNILINNIINLPELTATAIALNKQPLLLKFRAILTDAYRLQVKANKYDSLVEKMEEMRQEHINNYNNTSTRKDYWEGSIDTDREILKLLKGE